MKLFEIPSHELWACQHSLNEAIKLSRNMLYQLLGFKEPLSQPAMARHLQWRQFPMSSQGDPKAKLPKGPVSSPPNLPPGFKCDYSTAAAGSGTNWLEKTISDDDPTGGDHNIFTDYDDLTPRCITSEYHLNVTDHLINADGLTLYVSAFVSFN